MMYVCMRSSLEMILSIFSRRFFIASSYKISRRLVFVATVLLHLDAYGAEECACESEIQKMLWDAVLNFGDSYKSAYLDSSIRDLLSSYELDQLARCQNIRAHLDFEIVCVDLEVRKLIRTS